MGVEIALYALPADWCVLKKVLSNEIRGDVLQNIKGDVGWTDDHLAALEEIRELLAS